MQLTIIDTNSGNIKSLYNFFKRNFEYEIRVLKYAEFLKEKTNILILPGVGNFGYVSKEIMKMDQGEKIKNYYLSGNVLIGICLGAQFFTKDSEEAPNFRGLGLIDANCRSLKNHNSYSGRVPRTGWIGLKSPEYTKKSFYFVHSYYIEMGNNTDSSCKVDYCSDGVTAMIQKNNLLATQFHPEKSSDSGIEIVKNFINKNV